MMRGTTQPMPAVQQQPTPGLPPDSQNAQPSYYLTRWPFVNSILALVERLTHGRAGVLQRVFTYLLFGGTAALVNLGTLALMLRIPLPVNDFLHNNIALVVASEISILANFIPNDAITFSRLPGHQRSWWKRCLRFHTTSIAGTLLTIGLENVFVYALGLNKLIAQAIAIIIALFFNFTVHHLFTYSHIRGTEKPHAA